MPALIASLTTALCALFFLRVLSRRDRSAQNASGRIREYLAVAWADGSPKVRKRADWRSLGQSVGRFTPRRITEHYSQVLQQAAVPIKGEEMGAAIGVCILLGLTLGGLLLSLPGLLIGAVIGGKLPGLLLKAHLKRRLRLAEQQLVDFLNLCANAMRAGQSLLQSLELAARELPEPLGLELTRTLRETNLGLPVEEALPRLVQRLPSADLDLLVTAVLIQRQVGGDLASILDNLAATVRERQRVKAEVRTITAHGRLSGWVISLLPVVIALFLNVSNHEYISLLWSHPLGLLMLGSGVMSTGLGVYAINRIVQIDI